MKRASLLIALGLLVAGCGSGDNGAVATDTDTTTQPAETTQVRVYWLRDGKVWPAAREVAATAAVADAALSELLLGPTAEEETDLGLETAVPADWQHAGIGVENGVASVEIVGAAELAREALAQVVYTLSQFPTVESVEMQGRTLTRADFEELTPAILVESPLAFDEVASPLRVTGTANTFEATFQYELTDTDGRIVDESFVTATSGSGERGTFDFTTDEFTVPFDGVGSLIVFELSAEDGSRINLVETPVRLRR